MTYASIIEFDTTIFHLINTGWSNSVLDLIFPIVRSKFTWIPLYVFIVSYLLFNLKKQGWKILILLIITVVLADGLSSHAIKKNVQRIRPCNNVNVVVVERIECGSGYSFTSSHAANHFSIAIFLILAVIRRKWIKLMLIFWAFIISIAQVYVGVHYPSDVIAGALLGLMIAFIMHWIGKKILVIKI